MLTQETQSPMTNYLSVYGSGDTLLLPRPVRAYFDCGADEWNTIDPKQKLLDIGYVTSMGYDILQDVKEILGNHPYISENEIRHSIGLLFAELSGRSLDAIADRYDFVPLEEMVSDLKEHVVNQYILPNDGSAHYLIGNSAKMTDEDMLKANHWNIVADECQGNDALFSEEREYIYPGDEVFVHSFNSSATDETRLVVNTVPYPFQGNPLSAKVVILSLNAGYVPRVNNYFAKILQHYPRLAEGVMIFMRDNLRLRVRGFMPEIYNPTDFHPNYQDAFNMLGDWYWYDILSKLEKDDLNMEQIFSNVAIIQHVPYASVKAKDLPKGCILPSQMFTKKMIRYIADYKDAIFVVPRAVKKWKSLLGSTWTRLEEEGRIVIGRNPLNQHLTEKNLGTENYQKIINHLKG